MATMPTFGGNGTARDGEQVAHNGRTTERQGVSLPPRFTSNEADSSRA